jgi:NAD(P)-dependent dehydrogenase (short-subunit alcohol dehydrogenase family)
MNTWQDKTIVVVGASGAIGSAVTKRILKDNPKKIYLLSKNILHKQEKYCHHIRLDYDSESSIRRSADTISNDEEIDMVFVATGILHNETIMPEKSFSEINAEKFLTVFTANMIFPALIAKHFLPLLNTKTPSIFAALSARVGSISDNHLGGWYAYRCSKAALNMFIKSASIEQSRKNKKSIVIGLHPGSVDSNLSNPFKNNIPKDKLFSPSYCAEKLLEVLATIQNKQSGKIYAWDGKEVLP